MDILRQGIPCHLHTLMAILQVNFEIIHLLQRIHGVEELKWLWQLLKAMLISKHCAQPIGIGR